MYEEYYDLNKELNKIEQKHFEIILEFDKVKIMIYTPS